MDVWTAIATRASAVRLGSPAPSSDDVERLLTAGARAPDHGRLRPMRFVVLQGDAREQLAQALSEATKRRQPLATPEQCTAERARAFLAPVVIACAAHVDRQHKVPELEQVLSVAAGVQNMFLLAHSLGYGCHWKTGWAAYDDGVKEALGLRVDDHIVAFLHVGTVLKSGKPRAITLEGIVSR